MRLAALKAKGGGISALEGSDGSYPCTIAKVRNDSGVALSRFDVVGLGAPIISPTDNLAEFKRQPTFKIVKPVAGTHEDKYAVLLEPLASGSIGAAALPGIVVPVRLTGTDVGLAEIADGVTTFAASNGGSARVLWADSGSSERWALVRLGGKTVGTKAALIEFTLPSALATTDASKAGCTVDNYIQGPNPGATVTVYNKTASSNYIFSGASGHKGWAAYDDRADKYRILQIECP